MFAVGDVVMWRTRSGPRRAGVMKVGRILEIIPAGVVPLPFVGLQSPRPVTSYTVTGDKEGFVFWPFDGCEMVSVKVH